VFEFALGCAGDAKLYSPFEVGAKITEIGMLGVLVLGMQQTLDWDKNCQHQPSVGKLALARLWSRVFDFSAAHEALVSPYNEEN
jgi:hypothetical protein